MGKIIESRHYRFQQLADGVLAAFAVDGGGAFANSGIIDLGDKTLIYDTSITPNAARDLLHAAKHLSQRDRVDYVVNSHYHKDHVRGNIVFPPGTHIVSTRTTRELLLARGKQHIKRDMDSIYTAIQRTDRMIVELYDRLPEATQDDLKFAAGWQRAVYESLHKLRLRFPDITFDRRVVINGSQRRAVLINFEDAHTASDVILYLPEDDIAFVADLLMPQRHRWLGEMQVSAFEDALNFLDVLNLTHVVPGHGDTTAPTGFDAQLEYARRIETLVRDMVATGANRDAVMRLPCPPEYADWRFKEMLYLMNLDALFDRFTDHPPTPAPNEDTGVSQRDSLPYRDNP